VCAPCQHYSATAGLLVELERHLSATLSTSCKTHRECRLLTVRVPDVCLACPISNTEYTIQYSPRVLSARRKNPPMCVVCHLSETDASCCTTHLERNIPDTHANNHHTCPAHYQRQLGTPCISIKTKYSPWVSPAFRQSAICVLCMPTLCANFEYTLQHSRRLAFARRQSASVRVVCHLAATLSTKCNTRRECRLLAVRVPPEFWVRHLSATLTTPCNIRSECRLLAVRVSSVCWVCHLCAALHTPCTMPYAPRVSSARRQSASCVVGMTPSAKLNTQWMECSQRVSLLAVRMSSACWVWHLFAALHTPCTMPYAPCVSSARRQSTFCVIGMTPPA
jgi:hypothetical protein